MRYITEVHWLYRDDVPVYRHTEIGPINAKMTEIRLKYPHATIRVEKVTTIEETLVHQLGKPKDTERYALPAN